MSRRKLDRYSVVVPSDTALCKYYRLYDRYTLHTCPEALPMITSPTLFHNTYPLMLDIGCGRGEFAIQQAQSHPEWNVVGIDMQRKALYDAVHQANHLGLKNVYFIKADLRGAMCKIPEGVVTAAFLLFPAPVMQHKHRKKDLLTPRFIAALSRALVPQGTLMLVTDHREYFAQKD